MKLSLKRNLIVLAALAAVIALAFVLLHQSRTEGAGVSVCVNGVEVARYALSDEGTYELNGGTNRLLIQDGQASIIWADCPDGICVRQGKIRYTGQCITCLPNRLTVTVYGGDSDVDLVI